jgi:hypothetical protein
MATVSVSPLSSLEKQKPVSTPVLNRNYSAILTTLQITSYVDSRNSSQIVCRKLS